MGLRIVQGQIRFNISKIALAIPAIVLMVAVMFSLRAHAETASVVVTPDNTQGWTTADTRPGGEVQFVEDSNTPAGTGALQLKTNATTTAKAQYMHEANVPLNDVADLAYATKQVSGPVHAGASYQLAVDVNGATTGGFTTFVYEPYQNGSVSNGIWQDWDVDAGQLWSSRTATCSGGGATAGGGGAPFYSLSQLQTMCPEAVVVAFGVNIGSNNPSYDVRSDLVNFNGTTYDFELMPYVASTKDECKNGGWMNFQAGYKNQGQCVSSVANGRHI